MYAQTVNDSVDVLALMPSFLDPVALINSFGNWVLAGVLAVVFIESGLLFPLLPGDSLLFTSGMLSSQPDAFAPLWLLLITIPLAAFVGDQVGYLIGREGGAALFKSNDARFFKKKYIDEAHAFFEKYGPATITLARFVPIVRTFAPLVAGASRMHYRTFVAFNVIGAVAWGTGVTLLGYFLGNISFIRDNIDLIFILIVLLSVMPILYEGLKRFRRKSPDAPEPDAAPSPDRTDSADPV